MNAEKRISELDGLRGCAILLVTVWHSVMLIDPANGAISYWIWRLSIFGQSGVDLFFVLSGFLIVGILSDHKESEAYFSTFYTRRALRILPPYLILIIGFYLLTRLLGTGYYIGARVPLWALLTFIQNWFFVSTQGTEPAARHVVAGHRRAVLPRHPCTRLVRSTSISAGDLLGLRLCAGGLFLVVSDGFLWALCHDAAAARRSCHRRGDRRCLQE
ncbi:acyltransferase [Bradyrhizobium sp. LTSPM299]|uniref:acyltransferase family protein n=1 Tax=Bradyrhizobium sp. LTSPM299 TaxID=1619233 RepID=UPI0009E4EEE5|nr:acyltransferase [Bradyrhizobium sp. LTSPM299]